MLNLSPYRFKHCRGVQRKSVPAVSPSCCPRKPLLEKKILKYFLQTPPSLWYNYTNRTVQAPARTYTAARGGVRKKKAKSLLRISAQKLLFSLLKDTTKGCGRDGLRAKSLSVALKGSIAKAGSTCPHQAALYQSAQEASLPCT